MLALLGLVGLAVAGTAFVGLSTAQADVDDTFDEEEAEEETTSTDDLPALDDTAAKDYLNPVAVILARPR